MSEKPSNLFDLRVIERNIDKKIITQEEIEQHKKDLPDLEDVCVPMFYEEEVEEAEESEESEEAKEESEKENASKKEEA